MAQTLSAENIAAERPAAPPKNTRAWDALMIELCEERARLEEEASGYRALTSQRKKALKARVIDAQSTMGAFDQLYDLWQIREAAEESGDDSILRARIESTNDAYRALSLGTQIEMPGLDPAAKAAEEAARTKRMDEATAAGSQAGAAGEPLAAAYATWTASGSRSKAERRAFEDAFADAAQAAGHARAPSDAKVQPPVQWLRQTGKRGRMSKEEIAEKAAFEAAHAPRMESVAGPPTSTVADAYQFGWSGHEAGQTMNEMLYEGHAIYPANDIASRAQLILGWGDRAADFPEYFAHKAESALERTARIEADLPDGGDDEQRRQELDDRAMGLEHKTECVGEA